MMAIIRKLKVGVGLLFCLSPSYVFADERTYTFVVATSPGTKLVFERRTTDAPDYWGAFGYLDQDDRVSVVNCRGPEVVACINVGGIMQLSLPECQVMADRKWSKGDWSYKVSSWTASGEFAVEVRRTNLQHAETIKEWVVFFEGHAIDSIVGFREQEGKKDTAFMWKAVGPKLNLCGD
ncbi:MAG: hypothetical protein EP335_02885 [Alphaproteobacteria bacterium]|nr:MAG: hypothetical protein EP335_02885 [Alphaproteobacteria bacterium]